MKRALAERAKQALDNSTDDLSTTATTLKLSSSPKSPSLKRIRKVELPPTNTDAPLPPLSNNATAALPAAKESRDSVATTSNGTASGRKRQRKEQQNGVDLSTVSDEASAFYLKHQNRALATELKSVQKSFYALQEERDYRRQKCNETAKTLNSINSTWTQIETALASVSVLRQTNAAVQQNGSRMVAPILPATAPMSTHNVSSNRDGSEVMVELSTHAVEWTAALSTSLAALGQRTGDDVQRTKQQDYTQDMTTVSDGISARVAALQNSIWTLLSALGKDVSISADSFEKATLAKELSDVQGECRLLQVQVAELTKARDEVSAKERRCRRNVYRLAAGMLTTEQLMNAVDDDTDDVAAQVKLEAQMVAPKIESNSGMNEGKNVGTVSAAKLESTHARIRDLEQMLSNRDTMMNELKEQVKERDMRINELVGTQRTVEEAEKLVAYEAASKKLELTETKISALEAKVKELMEKWATALGNEKAAFEALEDLQSKQIKRIAELAELDDDANCSEDTERKPQSDKDAETITTLKHKLGQAMENVRQAESMRDVLKDSLSMNESLQKKLDEAKVKLTAANAARGNAAAAAQGDNNSEGNGSKSAGKDVPIVAANNKEKDVYPATIDKASGDKYAAAGGEKVEKLQREHRRMRKDLAALTASKDAAKAKVERLEKERDGLMESTNRLMRQITEKDDMNAKSLSTILHLKSISEQVTQEKNKLDEEAKSASQLSLAARLATHAKERVNDEATKENVELSEKVKLLEDKLNSTQTELSRITADFSGSSAKITQLEADLKKQLDRSNELASECSEKKAELNRLVEALDRTERESKDLREKVDTLTEQSIAEGGAGAAFSFDQLNTHIQVLKNRLACPVCHYRDKECIIMRCRHMHCKQCVEERISNRSRKCPTCNNRFAENDVEDIWLN